MNFVRVGRVEALLIEARVVAQTRQMITCRVELKRENDELIAEASSQQLLLPMKA
jgi:acyl-coenzyme A thioesterase PaaI-like protein